MAIFAASYTVSYTEFIYSVKLYQNHIRWTVGKYILQKSITVLYVAKRIAACREEFHP